jgi:hypothetical protein
VVVWVVLPLIDPRSLPKIVSALIASSRVMGQFGMEFPSMKDCVSTAQDANENPLPPVACTMNVWPA